MSQSTLKSRQALKTIGGAATGTSLLNTDTNKKMTDAGAKSSPKVYTRPTYASLEGRTSTLRIYGGEVTVSAASGIKYKGIAVSSKTTAAEVIVIALQRFGMDINMGNQVELRYVRQNRRNMFRRDKHRGQYVLKASECPLVVADCFDDERRFQLFTTRQQLEARLPETKSANCAKQEESTIQPAKAEIETPNENCRALVSTNSVSERSSKFSTELMITGAKLLNPDRRIESKPLQTVISSNVSKTSDSGRGDSPTDSIGENSFLSIQHQPPMSQRKRAPPPPPPTQARNSTNNEVFDNASVFPFLTRLDKNSNDGVGNAHDSNRAVLSTAITVGTSDSADIVVNVKEESNTSHDLYCKLVPLGCDVAMAPMNNAAVFADGELVKQPVTLRNHAEVSVGSAQNLLFKVGGATSMRTTLLEPAAARQLFNFVEPIAAGAQNIASEGAPSLADVSNIPCRPNSVAGSIIQPHSHTRDDLIQFGSVSSHGTHHQSSTPVPVADVSLPREPKHPVHINQAPHHPSTNMNTVLSNSQTCAGFHPVTMLPPSMMPSVPIVPPGDFQTIGIVPDFLRQTAPQYSNFIPTQAMIMPMGQMAPSLPSMSLQPPPPALFSMYSAGRTSFGTQRADSQPLHFPVDIEAASAAYAIDYYDNAIRAFAYQKSQLPGVANKRKRQKLNSKIDTMMKKRDALWRRHHLVLPPELARMPFNPPITVARQVVEQPRPASCKVSVSKGGLNAEAPAFLPSKIATAPTYQTDSDGPCDVSIAIVPTASEKPLKENAGPCDVSINVVSPNRLESPNELALKFMQTVPLQGKTESEKSKSDDAISDPTSIPQVEEPANEGSVIESCEDNFIRDQPSDTSLPASLPAWASIVNNSASDTATEILPASPDLKRPLTVLSKRTPRGDSGMSSSASSQESPKQHKRGSIVNQLNRNRATTSSLRIQSPLVPNTPVNDDKENGTVPSRKTRTKSYLGAQKPGQFSVTLRPTGISLAATPKGLKTRPQDSPGGVVETSLDLSGRGLRKTGLLQNGTLIRNRGEEPIQKDNNEQLDFSGKRALWM